MKEYLNKIYNLPYIYSIPILYVNLSSRDTLQFQKKVKWLHGFMTWDQQLLSCAVWSSIFVMFPQDDELFSLNINYLLPQTMFCLSITCCFHTAVKSPVTTPVSHKAWESLHRVEAFSGTCTSVWAAFCPGYRTPRGPWTSSCQKVNIFG